MIVDNIKQNENIIFYSENYRQYFLNVIYVCGNKNINKILNDFSQKIFFSSKLGNN